MSRHISCRYLLFYLCVSAILTCGLSRRVPRRASCPSCSQDCPEALTVQLPQYPRQESDLQPVISRDFSINQNSLYSRLMQKRMFQDVVDNNNVLLNENAMSFGNYRSFPQQASTSESSIFNKFHTNNKFPEYADRRTISQNNFAREYPPVYVSPPRLFFDRSENLFLRNPRNKNSEFSLENQNFQSYTKDEDPANKMFVVYRTDKNTEPSWENLKDTSSSNIILPQRFFPKIENTFRQSIPDKEKSMIEKTISPANRKYDFTYFEKEYYPTNFVNEIKPNYIVPQNIRKLTKTEEFFDDWDTNDLLQSSNLRQLTQTTDDLLRMHPADKQEIITEENNDHFNRNSYMFPQELDIWKPTEKEEKFFNNLNFTSRKNSQKSAEMKQLQKVENNWLYPAMNTRHFDGEEDEKYFENEENMNRDYFDDDIGKDVIMTDRDSYNPYALFQGMNIWKPIQDKELSDDLDFTHGNLQDVQKEEQLEMYPNNNYFQNEEEGNMNIDEAHADQIIHPSVINPFNAKPLSRYLDILSNLLKPPAESSKTQELSKPKNNIHVNSIEKRNKRLFKDETIKNEEHQNPVPPTNIFYIRKHNNPAADAQNVKTNVQNETLTKFDPDLLDDIEDPLMEPTEPTSTDSPIELSTPQQ